MKDKETSREIVAAYFTAMKAGNVSYETAKAAYDKANEAFKANI